MKGLECITTIDNVNKFQWHNMMHKFAEIFKARQKVDPTFKR